jgi:dipeptidyl-peptidase-4
MRRHNTLLFWRPVLSVVLLSYLTIDDLSGQDLTRPKLTLEDIFLNEAFTAASFASGKWAESGPIVRFIVPTGPGETSIVSYDLESDDVVMIVDGAQVFADDVDRNIQIDDYAFSADGQKVLLYVDSEKVWRLNTRGYYYVFDLETRQLAPISDRDFGPQMFAKFDPAGERVAFVRNRNIVLVDLATGKETRLTTDGAAGGVINGTSDWVYEEEFGLRNAWHWSPDGNHIAFLQLDETRTRDYWLPEFRGQYPEFVRYRYPKAGESNSEIRAGVIDVATGETTFFETDTWYAGGDEHEYLTQVGWTPAIDGASRVWTFRLNRDQNNLDLIYGDPITGSTEIVLNEFEDTYLDVKTGFNDLDVGKLTFLADDQHFVWVSEADGYKHLYLHENGGRRIGQMTSGEWQVADFHGVDEVDSLAYFTATIDHPTERQLYSIPFSTTAPGDVTPNRITQGKGWHEANLSTHKKFFIDSYSSLEAPLTATLRHTDGEELRVLEENANLRANLDALNVPPIELIEVEGDSGITLNAYMVKPSSFEPTKEYPLMLYVYGGPGSQRVRNEWQEARGLWHQYLAETHDIIVVCIDSRGTGGRGKEFESASYRQLGIVEAADFIAAATSLGARTYIDADRIGIWGWSYGGFMTLNSMFMGNGPETFKLGVAVSPIVNWRQYDTIYTERYMSTPKKNEEGYRMGSPITYVDRMTPDQRLLLIHGTGDDNVHFQNSIQLVDALQEAGKQFEFMAYPGKTHSILGAGTQFHLFTLITNFIAENL